MTEPAGAGDRIELETELAADHGQWLAVRAWGEPEEPLSTIVAHSAPVYVVVGEEPSWKAEAVPELVEYHRGQLEEFLSDPVDPDEDLEPWETRELLIEQWERQRPLLEPRVRAAHELYQELLIRLGRIRPDVR